MMNTKRLFKIITIVVLAVIMIGAFSNTAHAAVNWANSAKTFAETNGDTNVNNSAKTIVGAIIGAVRIIAVGVAVIMLAVLAMKYMMSAPGDKADIKKHAVVYVVGAVILFAVSGILGIIAKFASVIS